MNKQSWKNLKPGDMIQNSATNSRFVLTMKRAGVGWVAVRTIFVSDHGQWRKVTKEEKENLT